MARDQEVDDLLENGNMEQLAALVLNGEGRRLVGRQSGNPELQAFIDNVPTYMVHMPWYSATCSGRTNTHIVKNVYIPSGKDSRGTHGGTRREPSRFAERVGPSQVRGGAGRIVASWRNAVTRGGRIRQYRCHQARNIYLTVN